jgi:hypothetical protein
MLARAERAVGLASWAVTAQQNYLNYATDEVLLGPNENRLKLELKRLPLLFRIWRSFDIVHFNSGQTLMPQRVMRTAGRYSSRLLPLYQSYVRLVELRDLPLLKAMGKGIVVTFQGDDARQGDYCAAHFDVNAVQEVEPGYYTAGADTHRRHRIAYIARYADRIYALNPDLMHVLPPQTKYLPYANVDPREWQPAIPSSAPAVPLVIHAPSHRGVKGTRFVLEAVQRLEADGAPFKFILVEGLSNAEARQLYQQADLLVDQLLIGWYGGLAVEMMALGKPVICYLREGDLKFIPPEMRAELPVIHATPTTLYSTLKTWLTSRKHELGTLGCKSRAFVERWHDPLKIAGQLKQDYADIVARQPKRSRA